MNFELKGKLQLRLMKGKLKSSYHQFGRCKTIYFKYGTKLQQMKWKKLDLQQAKTKIIYY